MALGPLQVQKVGRVSRKPRVPEHRFQLRVPPYALQCFMLAPVLAGETLKNALIQSRVVSDPVKNPLIGWWHEMQLYYVKLRDFQALAREPRFAGYWTEAQADAVLNMLIDPDAGAATIKVASASNTNYRTAASQIPWAREALKLILGYYYRDENEVVGVDGPDITLNSNQAPGGTVGSYAGTWSVAGIQQRNAFDSLLKTADYQAPPDPGISVAGDNLFTMSEFEAKWREWNMQRQYGFTTLTYEDYLREQGASVPTEQLEGKPELLRYIREWTYPSNTVNPATGVPSSALSWAIAERADKDRFFKEPGFIVGVTVTRPKVYLSNQGSSIANFMDNALSWLPRSVDGDAYAGMKEFAAAAGPLVTSTTGYWLDIRDLLVHGDQFVNFNLSEVDGNLHALPTAGQQQKYPAAADISALFSTALNNYIRQDGICRLTILGHTYDRTAPT